MLTCARMKIQPFMAAGLVLGSFACGGDDDGHTHDSPEVVEAEALLAEHQDADYRSYARILGWDLPHLESSRPHHGPFIDIYVNETLAAAIEGSGAPFPDGSVVVKDGWNDAEGTELFQIAIMEKQGTDWFYAEYSADGEVDVAGIDPDECMECHTVGTDHILAL